MRVNLAMATLLACLSCGCVLEADHGFEADKSRARRGDCGPQKYSEAWVVQVIFDAIDQGKVSKMSAVAAGTANAELQPPLQGGQLDRRTVESALRTLRADFGTSMAYARALDREWQAKGDISVGEVRRAARRGFSIDEGFFDHVERLYTLYNASLDEVIDHIENYELDTVTLIADIVFE